MRVSAQDSKGHIRPFTHAVRRADSTLGGARSPL
jgi:hypothetical protein